MALSPSASPPLSPFSRSNSTRFRASGRCRRCRDKASTNRSLMILPCCSLTFQAAAGCNSPWKMSGGWMSSPLPLAACSYNRRVQRRLSRAEVFARPSSLTTFFSRIVLSPAASTGRQHTRSSSARSPFALSGETDACKTRRIRSVARIRPGNSRCRKKPARRVSRP